MCAPPGRDIAFALEALDVSLKPWRGFDSAQDASKRLIWTCLGSTRLFIQESGEGKTLRGTVIGLDG